MKKFFVVLIAIVIGFFVLSTMILPQIVSQSEIQKFLKEKIREKAGDKFDVEKIGVGFFPSAFVEVKGLKVYLPSAPGEKPILEVRKARLYLKIIPLFFKRFEASNLELSGAQFSWDLPKRGHIQLTGINGVMRGLSFTAPAKFKLKGLVYGQKHSTFSADGTVEMSLEKLKAKLTQFDLRFNIDNILPQQLIEAGLVGEDFPVTSGELDARGSLVLDPESKNITGKVSATASKIAVKENAGVSQVPGIFSIASQFQYTQQSRVLELGDCAVLIPGLSGSAFGTMNFLAEPQLDLSFRFKEIRFDDIKKYYAKQMNGVRFSGVGSGSLILKGTSAKMLVNASADLTQTAVDVESYGSKPSGLKLVLTAQTYVAGSRASEGEFNAHLGDMAVKGAMEKMDLKTGIGEINFITNKFPLDEWNGLVKALQTLKVSGNGKIAANIKGNFKEPGSLGYNAHVTLDNATFEQDGKAFIQSLSGSFDFEPEKIGIQESNLLFGKSNLQAAMDLRDFTSPFFQARITSSHLDVEDVTALVARLKEFRLAPLQAKPAPAVSAPVETSWLVKEAYAQAPPQQQQAGVAVAQLPPIAYRAKGTVDFKLSNVIASGRQLENLIGRAEWNQGDLTLRDAKALMGQGGVSANANVTWRENPPAFNAHLETQGVPLEAVTEKPFVTGRLSSTTDVRGLIGNSELVTNSLAGAGAFQVVDGEIHGFSLLSSLSALPSLVGLKGSRFGGTTDFKSLDGQFQIGGQKIQFSSISMQSKTISAVAEGAVGFDKSIYFKGTVEVSGNLGGLLGNTIDRNNPLRFPLEVTGTTDHPSLSVASQAAIGTTIAKDVLGQFWGKKKKTSSTSSSTVDTATTAAELLSSILGK